MNGTAILGFRHDGRPIWGFAGAEGEDDGGGSDGGNDGGGNDTGGGSDPDKDALTKERDDHKATRAKLRPFRSLMQELGVKDVDELRTRLATPGSSGGSEPSGQQQQKPVDAEAIRQEALRSARQEAARDIALAKVEALAAGSFNDPEDAVNTLRDSVDDLLTDEGKPDTKAIERELASLLQRKPHFGRQEQSPPGFDGGARGTAATPKGMDGFIREVSARKRGNR